jgi:TPR repeat protein
METVDWATAMLGWYRKAAEQGHAAAQSDLAAMYAKGLGVRQDYTEAMKWVLKAAEQGDADAQHNLGIMYGRGEGVPRDDVRAHMWFNLAAANGNKDAIAKRNQVARSMTPAQIIEAQRLAREWKPTNPTPTSAARPR